MPPTSPVARSPLTVLRIVCLVTLGTQAALFALLLLLDIGFGSPGAVWLALPLVLGFANVVLVPAVGSTVRPLPYGAPPDAARRISARVLATVTYLRLALAESPALIGMFASLAAGSLVPYGLGLVFAVPLTLWFVFPHERVVADVRQRLESSGVASHLAGR
jgi:hypothetical protein